MDRKRILWTVTLFFGCYVLFSGIDTAASGSGKAVSLAIQAAAAAAVIVALIVIVRRRS